MSVAYEWLVNESVAYERLWRLAFCIPSVTLVFGERLTGRNYLFDFLPFADGRTGGVSL